MALKAQTALQAQVHDTLYNNIKVLTYLHRPHRDFQTVFKKDMFAKSNKSAFIHVVYYLLHALDPNTVKEKILSWPVLDPHSERQFRSEVVKYLNELNDLYENANIPLMMASQLVSPGGYRFAKYMLKLSVLVMRQYLTSNCEDINNKIIAKPNLQKIASNSEKPLKNINRLTAYVNRETEQSRLNYHHNYVKCKDEADGIVNRLNQIQIKIGLLQNENSIPLRNREELNRIYEDKIDLLSLNLSKIQTVSDKLKQIKERLDCLAKANLTLRNSTSEELNLICFCERFNLEMEKHCLEMNTITELELDSYIREFGKCNGEFVRLRGDITDIQKQWINLSADIRSARGRSQNCRKILHEPNQFPLALSSGDSTILAVPLDASE